MNRLARPAASAALALVLVAAPAAPAELEGLPSETPSHTRAYLSLALGVTLTGASFLLAEAADRAYDDYLGGVDADAIQRDYDRSIRLDRLASATLIAGQAALALGIYWRFLRRRPAPPPSSWTAAPASPSDSPVGWTVDPLRRRIGISFRFR